MRNKKFLILLSIVMLLVISMTFVLAACDITDKDGDEPDIPIKPRPSRPTEPENGIGSVDLIKKVFSSINATSNVVNIDFGVDVKAMDSSGVYKYYRVSLKSNILPSKNEKDLFDELELALVVKELGSKTLSQMVAMSSSLDDSSMPIVMGTQIIMNANGYENLATSSTEDKVLFGLYGYNDKMFVDLGDDRSMLYLEDFDLVYIAKIIDSVLGLVDGLGDIQLGPLTVSSILDILLDMLFFTTPTKTTVDGVDTYAMEMTLIEFISQLPALLDLLGGLLGDIPVDLGAIIRVIVEAIPPIKIMTYSSFENDKLNNFTIDIEDRDGSSPSFGKSIANIKLGIVITDKYSKIDMPELPTNYKPFSFTNITFDVDLIANTSGEELDLGTLINTFTGENTLPADKLMLSVEVGLRISVSIDLDLNYNKEPGDKNLIAIEAFFLDQAGNTVGEPVLGLYYKDGAAYVNLDNLMPNYYTATNIQIKASLNDLITGLVGKLIDLIDDGLGIEYQSVVIPKEAVKQGSLDKDNKASQAVMSMMTAKNDDGSLVNPVLTYTVAEEGRGPIISQGFVNFFDSLMLALKINSNDPNDTDPNYKPIEIKDNNIKITINNIFFERLKKAFGVDVGFNLPDSVGDIVLDINLADETSANGGVTATITGSLDKFNIKIKAHNLGIGYQDEELLDRVEQGTTSALPFNYKLSDIMNSILGGVNISAGMELSFNKGAYNFGPLLAAIGLNFMKDEKLLWTFTDDFTADVNLTLQIALDKVNPINSTFVLEVKTDNGIKIGNDAELMPANTVIFGVYGYKNSVYIDATGIKIANIKLPQLKADLNFTEVLYNLIDSLLASQDGFENGDFVLDFNTKDLISQLPFASNVASSNGSVITTNGSTNQPNADAQRIWVGLNNEGLALNLSLFAIIGLLKEMNVVGDDVLSILDDLNLQLGIAADFTLNNGITINAEGDLIPQWNGNKNVYNSDFKLSIEAGTPSHRIIIGDISDVKYNFSAKEQAFNKYEDDLIQAIVDTVGKLKLDVTIDTKALNSKFNITRIINGILASEGKSFALPIGLEFEDGNTEVKLGVKLNLDLKDFMKTQVDIKLTYDQKVMLGVSLYRGDFVLDLTGLGFFRVKITNSPIVELINNLIGDLIKDIGDFNLTDAINGLLEDYLDKDQTPDLPTGGVITGGNGQEGASQDNGLLGDLDDMYVDLIKYIITSVSATNARLNVNMTSQVIDGILKSLLGVDLGVDISFDAQLDALEGTFGATVGLNDVKFEIGAALTVGENFDLGSEIDFDSIVDWDASTGQKFAKNMLDNLDIGLNVDLRMNSPAGHKLANTEQWTRVSIEKVKTRKSLPNTNGAVAEANTFLVTIAGVDKDRYSDTERGGATPIAYLVLDYNAGGMYLSLGKNILNLVVDFSDFITNMWIELDLITTLGDLFQGLFDDLALMNLGETNEPAVVLNNEESSNTPSPASEEPDTFAPLAALFDNFDVIGLLGGEQGIFNDGGIKVSVSSALLNVNVKFNAYMLNKMIDDVMNLIFGPNSVLNLKELAPDMFDAHYLKEVRWGRINSTAFWDTLQPQLTPLLKSVVRSVEGGAYAWAAPLITPGLLNSVFHQIKILVTRLLPFPVFDTVNLGLNIVDGTFANLYLDMYDYGNTIYIDNDPSKGVYEWETKSGWGREIYAGINYDGSTHPNNRYNTSQYKTGSFGPNNPYATELRIFNTSNAVGNPEYNNGNTGIVLWKDVPSVINYDPNMYTDANAGFAYITTKMLNKDVTYQQGLKVIKGNTGGANKFTVTKNGVNKGTLSLGALDNLTSAGEYKITTTVTFTGGLTKTKEITLKVLGAGQIESIDDISMYAYQSLPETIIAHMGDGTTRRYETSKLNINGYKATEIGAHDKEATVVFPNGVAKTVLVKYKDSHIVNVFGGSTIPIDLYKFDTASSEISDFMGDGVNLYFQYDDGSYDTLPVVVWETDAADPLFNRNSTNVAGARYVIYVTIGQGALQQRIPVLFEVKSKNVVSMVVRDQSVKAYDTINETVTSFINVDPYMYYMYLATGDEQYNPYPKELQVTYYDTGTYQDGQQTKYFVDDYSENVVVNWSADSSNDLAKYSWNNDNKQTIVKEVVLDKTYEGYTGSFEWTKKVNVKVNRNQIKAVYFDKELTQTSLEYKSFTFNNNHELGINNFPEKAYVAFTNGLVLEMPIAWEAKARNHNANLLTTSNMQFKLAIAYDQTKYDNNNYELSADTTNILGSNLFQEFKVNVKIVGKDLSGINIDGSALNEGTKFYIDPVSYLYNNENPFPTTVKAVYSDNSEEVINAVWEFDYSTIRLGGAKNLVAYCSIADNIRYAINVEVYDRSNLAVNFGNNLYYVEVTNSNGVKTAYADQTEAQMKTLVANNTNVKVYSQLNVNSYEFTAGAYGTRIYNQFASKLDARAFINYIVNVKVNGEIESVQTFSTKAQADAFVATITDTTKNCEIIENYANYKIDATWSNSSINYRKNDYYNTYATFGTGETSTTLLVKVKVIYETVQSVGGQDYVYYAANAGADRVDQATIVRTLNVFFPSGAMIALSSRINVSNLGNTKQFASLAYDINGRLVPYVYDQSGNNITVQGGKVKVYVKGDRFYYMDGNAVATTDKTIEAKYADLGGLFNRDNVKYTTNVTYVNSGFTQNVTILPGTELQQTTTIKVHVLPSLT